jgi:hypothetical protein
MVDDEFPVIEVGPDGKVRSIYKDELIPLYQALGTVKRIERASHVEFERICTVCNKAEFQHVPHDNTVRCRNCGDNGAYHHQYNGITGTYSAEHKRCSATKVRNKQPVMCCCEKYDPEHFVDLVFWRSGWTVRAAKDMNLALRSTDFGKVAPSYEGLVITFPTREEALKEELKHFWTLVPEK